MDLETLVLYSISYVIFMPILTALHELGHATLALIFTDDIVSIQIGNSNLNKAIKLNRLVININGYRSLMDVSYGYINCKQISGKIKSILMIAGGPAVSLLISILMFNCLDNANLPYILMIIFNAIFIFSGIQFIITILPIKYNYEPYVGVTSDGYKILQWLKANDYNK